MSLIATVLCDNCNKSLGYPQTEFFNHLHIDGKIYFKKQLISISVGKGTDFCNIECFKQYLERVTK